jgi:hypothetical protein
MRLFQIAFCLCISFAAIGQKQEIAIDFGSQKLQTGETLKLKVIIKGSPDFNVSEFPQLPGFKKESRLVSHNIVSVDGKRQLQHTITQNYLAVESGIFEIPASVISVNGTEQELPAVEIAIESAEIAAVDDFIEASGNEEALFFLFLDKKEVYVGEAFRVHLAFYVSENNTAAWQFPKNLNDQVAAIASSVKPKNALESRKLISNVIGEPARIREKNYIRYKVYEALFYPLLEEDIHIPTQTFKMEELKNKSDSSLVTQKNFTSRPFSVKVKPLPDHPLKNKVPVGRYQLSDPGNYPLSETGKIITYSVIIEGEGNMASLNFDPPSSDINLDFYPATVSGIQQSGTATGNRVFTFKIFPKDSGTFDMGDYFQWIYFNTALKNYDTLKATKILRTYGERVESWSGNSGDIYAEIDKKLITDRVFNYKAAIKNTANVLLILMLASMLFIFDFKRQKPQ